MAQLTVGHVLRPIQGETTCGDAFVVRDEGAYVVVAVIDGLGHGPDAEIPAQRAVATVEANVGLPPERILEACHRALRETRGAVVAIARIDRAARTLTYAGIGNIEAVIIGREKVRRPVSVNGIVGYQARAFRSEAFAFEPGDLLVMHSDGISDSFQLTPAKRTMDPQMLALQLVNSYGRPNDDQVMVVVRDEA